MVELQPVGSGGIQGTNRPLTYSGEGGIAQLSAVQSEIPYLLVPKSAVLHRHEAVARAASGKIRTMFLIAEYAVPVQLAQHYARFRHGWFSRLVRLALNASSPALRVYSDPRFPALLKCISRLW